MKTKETPLEKTRRRIRNRAERLKKFHEAMIAAGKPPPPPAGQPSSLKPEHLPPTT